MSPEEWEVYQDRGYAMDETVGKDGAEGAFESYLHGTPGQKVLETDKDGRITGETNAVQPQAGRDVTLTLDRDLQAAAETGPGRLLGPPSPGHRAGPWWPWMSGTAGCWPW